MAARCLNLGRSGRRGKLQLPVSGQGGDLAIVDYVNADGSNVQHRVVSAGTAYPIGNHGAPVYPQSFYFPGIVFGQESYSGYRLYRTFNDGSISGTWGLERVNMPTLGGTVMRTTLDSAATGTERVTRPHVIRQNATDSFTGWVNRGTYGDFNSFRQRVQLFSTTGL